MRNPWEKVLRSPLGVEAAKYQSTADDKEVIRLHKQKSIYRRVNVSMTFLHIYAAGGIRGFGDLGNGV